MIKNIEYSKDWLLQKIIETDFKEKKENREIIIQMKYKDLLRLVLDFVKLNERGEL